MIDLLDKILCAILRLADAIATVFVVVLNHTFASLSLVVEWLVALLPEMPDAPDPPEEGVLAVVNWVVPLAGMLAFCGIALGLFLLFQGFQVALRWLKAL